VADRKLVAYVADKNFASAGVLEKCGFMRDPGHEAGAGAGLVKYMCTVDQNPITPE
jgi:RimJ/RimL family protein N-acetyltransferase